MAAPGRKYKGYWQHAREAVWGTQVPAAKRMPFIDMSVDPNLNVIPSAALDGAGFMGAMFAGNKRPAALVKTYLTYSNQLLLIDAGMGTAAFGATGGVDGAGPPYAHTYKQQDLFNSLTHEFVFGDIPTGKCETLIGAKIEQMKISGKEGGVLEVEYQFEGKDWAVGATPTAGLTSAALDVVRFSDMTTFNDGTGTTGTLMSFELLLKNNMHLNRSLKGSQLRDEPLKNGLPTVELTIVEEFQTNAAMQAHYALTQGAPALTFGSGALGFQIAIAKAYLTSEPKRTPEGDGRITQTLKWAPIIDTDTPAGYLVVVVTNQSALTTT